VTYTYKLLDVKRVVDGDTVDVVLDLGFRLTTTQRLRLLGVDAPERGTTLSREATEFVASWLEEHRGSAWVETRKTDSFGRYLATVHRHLVGLSPTLNAALLEAGLASPYRA
jgi:micrococcal nuclease